MKAASEGPSQLDEAALREPLRRALAAREARKLPLGSRTAAAVLIPLFERGGEARVWLVRRPDTMRSHGGQVAFPGESRTPRTRRSVRRRSVKPTRSSESPNRASTCSARWTTI